MTALDYVIRAIEMILREQGYNTEEVEWLDNFTYSSAFRILDSVFGKEWLDDSEKHVFDLLDQAYRVLKITIEDRKPNLWAWETETVSAEISNILLKVYIEISRDHNVPSYRLRDDLRKQIAAKLGETGMPLNQAAKIARITVDDFQREAGDISKRLARPYTAELAAQLVVSFNRALQRSTSESFNSGAAAPPRAAARQERLRRIPPAAARGGARPVIVRPASIPDVLVLEPEVYGDDRGFFMESWNRSEEHTSELQSH